jgi:hypothetical protein
MSFNIDFAPLANQGPWVNAAVTQSNPGSLQIESGTLYPTVTGTTNILSSAAALPSGRLVALSGIGPNYLGWDSSSSGPRLYVDYLDASNYLAVVFERPSSLLRLAIRKVVGGVTSTTYLTAEIPNAYFENTTISLSIVGQVVGSDYQVSATLDGTTYEHTSAGYTLAGQPAINVKRNSSFNYSKVNSIAIESAATGPDYTQRKGSTFDAAHTLGTITTATLNGTAITINTTGASTVNLTDSSGITTSGEYDLVLGDGAATETYTVQLNVFGVVPSNNPAQKDGSALASLTGVQIRITAGANLNGTQVYYSGTETTDASGSFSTLDVSTSAAVAADPVRMQVLTAAGDSITSAETVGLI